MGSTWRWRSAPFAAGIAFGAVPVREAAALGVAAGCLVGLGVSVARRRAGVRGQRAEHDRRTARVAAMTGIDRSAPAANEASAGPEYPPILDLVPVAIGVVGLVAAALDAGGNPTVALLRTLAGAAFLGAVTDAMLLGHWYLVQPGLPRALLTELVDAVLWIWPLEVLSMLLPTGMISVWTGAVDDGWGGVLGWFWAACAVATLVLAAGHQGRPARARLLGRDGGDRSALPRHPHRGRHRPHREGRPGRVNARVPQGCPSASERRAIRSSVVAHRHTAMTSRGTVVTMPPTHMSAAAVR